jgi:hypothetical protein
MPASRASGGFAKLPAGKNFVNLKRVSSGSADCQVIDIADQPSDFFAVSGENYISNPIRYTEFGSEAATAEVWTNFVPTGGGSYNALANTYGMCAIWEWMCSDYTTCGVGASHYYGIASEKNVNWAGVYWVKQTYNVDHTADCLAQRRALYCVQQ